MRFEQGTKEWLEARKNTIGASDAPAIIGSNPYKTPFQLYQEKKGAIQVEQNARMKWGHENEEHARTRYNREKELNVAPSVIIHPKYAYLVASLDGIDLDLKNACEIKSNNKKLHDKLHLDPSAIPQYHIDQMQFQMECLQINAMDYVSDDGSECIIIRVEKDPVWFDKHFPALQTFYECLMSNTPPAMTEKDYVHRDDFEWITAMEEYCKINALIKQYTERKESLKKQLISMSDGKSTKGGGGTLVKYTQKGRVDMKKIQEDTGIDLDMYRSKDIEIFMIREDR